MNRLYSRWPPDLWTSLLAYHFPGSAGKPDDLLDFSPLQLDALIESATQIQEARTR